MTSKDETRADPFQASRGVLMCTRCGAVTRWAADAQRDGAPACRTCGQPMKPYDPTENPVGTNPRNALWGFGAF